MTGRGRCKRRRKSMAGGRAAARGKKIDGNFRSPNLNLEITEKPSSSSRIANVPQTPAVDFLDLFTQARKSLSFTSPFDSDGAQASRAFASGACTLPIGVSHLSGRKRHKKLYSCPDKNTNPRKRDIWGETEEYFRYLNIEDIERLYEVSTVGSSSKEKCLLIPFLNNDKRLCGLGNTVNVMLSDACKKDNLIMENGQELNATLVPEGDGKLTQEGNGSFAMDSDGFPDRAKGMEIKEEHKKLGIGKDCRPFSGVQWLLGSRSKIYLASDRPSKKRKLLGRDAGLEKLLISKPVEGSGSVCHYCSYGDMGDPLNFLIVCASCGVMVHQRCYGVQEDVDSSWQCSWCKCKNVVGSKTETPCLLCPKRGGALKPVKKSSFGGENEGPKLEFAHLFCCLWIPELYLENTRTMEPIMNMDKLKDTRKKLICYLCKVKCGSCVRCSNGSCRTSFHPICAREARHKMEIWGKLGSEEVELRAFCYKHSEVRGDSGRQCTGTGEIPLTAELDLNKQSCVLDGEKLLDDIRISKVCQENKDASQPGSRCLENQKINNVNACTASNFTMILKKLIELGKVKAKDVASDIGVSHDSLITIISDDHMAPELQYKLLNWLKNHVYIGNLQNALKVKIKSLVMSESVANAIESDSSISLDESSISDAVPVKSVLPHGRNKNNLRTVKDIKSHSSKDTNNGEIPVDKLDSCPVLDEILKDPSGEVLVGKTQKMLFDPHLLQHNPGNSVRIEDKFTALEQCLPEGGLAGEGKQIQQMAACSFVLPNGHVQLTSYIHPLIYSKLMQTNVESLEKTVPFKSAVSTDREASQFEASSSSDFSCNNNQRPAGDLTSECNGANLGNFLSANNPAVLKLSPVDEVEGEVMYYQQRLLHNAASRKHITDGLIATIVSSLSQEIDAAGKQKWDTVLVSQYVNELRELKKQGRTERRQKEADITLAAATAAASSRMSFNRKDSLQEPSHQDTVGKEVNTCSVCCRKRGVCLKCCYGRCQTMFHPVCARSAGFYMTVLTIGRKLQHKAYCEKHSIEQRAKGTTQRQGIEEFKSLKQVRVELERLRFLCERVVKREKLKRELALCSHDILATSRDSVLHALACHPFCQPEVSYGSATTSVKGYTESNRSGSEVVLRSDDTTVDSTIAGKMRIKFSMSRESDQKTDQSTTSQNHFMLNPLEQVSYSRNQIPHSATTSWRLPDDSDKHSQNRKLMMTSEEVSMDNLCPPKGFVYVPVRYVSKDMDRLQDEDV